MSNPNSKLQQAKVKLTSWLEAVGIPYKELENGLFVSDKTGNLQKVEIVQQRSGGFAAQNTVALLADEIESHTRQIALKSFHALTVPLGYGEPIPVRRPDAPKSRLNGSDNFELVAMRHAEFRRVPNPSDEELLKYKPTMKMVLKRARSKYRYIFNDFEGMGEDDLMTYLQIWTCNYLGLYRVKDETENKKKLYSHLWQRMTGLLKIWYRRVKTYHPPPTVVTASAGLVYQNIQTEIQNHETDPLILPQTTKKLNKKAASESLKKRFNALPHDKMVAILTEYQSNEHLAEDVQMEARKKLNEHKAECPLCNVEKQAAGIDTFGTPEALRNSL